MTFNQLNRLVVNRFKKISHAIGRVQTVLLSSLLYFLLITPIGFIFQLVTFINRSFAKPSSTYWQPRDSDQDIKDVYQQF